MAIVLSNNSIKLLKGVHPDLVRVIKRAAEITTISFAVIEGVRTLERQKLLKAKGASKTLKSRHIPAKNGFAHAVDVVPIVDGKAHFSWPLYHKLAPDVKKAAKELNVPIEWGGDWKTFADGPHFQLPWASYPGNK